MKKIAIVSVTLGWLFLVGPGQAQAAPGPSLGKGSKTVRCLVRHQQQIKRYVTTGMDELARHKVRRALGKIDRAVRYAEGHDCHRHATYARALAAKAVIYFDGKRDRDRAFGLLAQAFRINPSVSLEGKPSVALVRLYNDVRLVARAETARTTVRTAAKSRRVALERWNQHRARTANLRFRRLTDGLSSTRRTRLRRAARLTAAGDALLKKKKLTAAYRTYRKALRLAPSNLALRERFGVVQLRLGDYSGALRTVEWIRKRAGDARANQLLKRSR
jgi:tetratricopeptide (TPR) repeat protein